MNGADAIVVGGGFFGCKVALALAEAGFRRVTLVEREAALMRRASYVNQARVHNGYHYPRSHLTGLRSSENFERFCDEYAYAIDDRFEMLYAIARGSRVTPTQFQRFCDSIGAPCRPAWSRLSRLFAPNAIDAVFSVREFAFDAVKIAAHVAEELRRANIDVRLSSEARIVAANDKTVRVKINEAEVETEYLFNCTYAELNGLGVPVKAAIKRELAELVLIKPAAEFVGYGVTVMDGPFFSFMPFPAGSCYSLSHVRYTPHESWYDAKEMRHGPLRSNATQMIRDAARFMPALAHMQVIKSMFEIKALLAHSEENDARPILFETSELSTRIISILGAKIDNIYDIVEIMKEGQWTLQPQKRAGLAPSLP